jgi:hypothetical protein
MVPNRPATAPSARSRSSAGESVTIGSGHVANERIAAAALRTAANRGRLQAVRGGDGEWWSSRNWVDEYLDTRYRRSVGT